MDHTVAEDRCPSCGEELAAEARFCGGCGRRIEAAVTSDDDWIGTVVASRYRVLRRLGQGGMGVVFEVEQTRLGKRAAMKVLSAELAGEARVQRQFQREAEAAARLEHPGVAQVLDFGWDRGRPYLVMELVHGVNLGDVLDRDGMLTPSRAAAILAGIAAPVDEAHARGVVHRDLKPENVLLTRDRAGRDLVKILDFGLAELAGQIDADQSGEHTIAGTPAYMAPEQIRGDVLDARADVYALACLAYRMIVGAPPFSAHQVFEVVTKHLTEDAVAPSQRVPGRGVGTAIDGVILAGLAKERDARPASAGELARAFAEAVRFDAWTTGISEPTPVDLAEDAVRRGATDVGDDDLRRADVDAYDAWIERRRTWRQRAIPIVVAAAAIAGVALWLRHDARPRDVEVEPNEQIEEATRVRPGVVRGARAAKGRDRDLLRVDTSGGATATLRVHLDPGGVDDLALALLAPDGHVLATVDEGGGGAAEELPPIRLAGLGGAPIVRVEAGLGAGPGGAWTVTITAEPARADVEAEPDDTDADAIPLAGGETLNGSSYRRGDVDRVRVSGAVGPARIELTGPAARTLRLRIRGGEPVAAPTTATLADGDVIEVLRAFDAPPGAIGYALRFAPAPPR